MRCGRGREGGDCVMGLVPSQEGEEARPGDPPPCEGSPLQPRKRAFRGTNQPAP